MRTALLPWMFGAVLACSGCSSEVDWYLTINTYATDDAIMVGDGTGLLVAVSSSDGGVWLVSSQWTVVAAPGPYSLSAGGDRAELYPYAPGTYVVQFDGWYRTSDGAQVQRSGFFEIRVSALFAL